MVEHTGVKWQGPKTKWVMVRCASRRILFFVGLDHEKEAVFIDEDNDFCWLNENQVDELPDCTGFDYVPEPEPTYPIWCVPPVGGEVTSGYRKVVAYYRYDSKNSGVTVHKDGSSFQWNEGSDLKPSGRRVVTQQEAKKQVCDPEEWVTQDRVPDRPGIDQWRRVYTSAVYANTDWQYSAYGELRFMHGDTAETTEGVFEVRCKLKDYPKEVTTDSCVKQDQHKPTSRTIGADGNDEREAAKRSGPEWITMFEIVREGALGREVVWVEHPGGLWQTGQTRFLRVK